jgi:hypothetical protein
VGREAAVRRTLDIQVRHPDGRIWHVRRRWARRRMPWRRAADDIPTWPATTADVLRDLSSLVGLPGLPGSPVDAALRGWLLFAVGALAVLAVWLLLVWLGAGLLAAAAWLARHLAVVAAAVAVILLLAALLLVRRPWLVVAERQGLADAPRRAWRLIGWRRSGRFAHAIAEAIRDGRFDASGVLVVSPPHEPREAP